MLSDRCPVLSCMSVCLSCPVCDVRALWPHGWMDQNETWHVGRPQPRTYRVRWGPNSSPSEGHSPQFSTHIRPNGCMDQDATSYAGRLGPGEFVLDGNPAPLPQKGGGPPNFRPIFIVAKRLDGSRWHLACR